MANKSDDKKTMDVAKPGKSTPDTSARPVIVTHRPMVQDPTLKDDGSKVAAGTGIANADVAPSARTSKTINPVSEDAAETPAEGLEAEASEAQPGSSAPPDSAMETTKETVTSDAESQPDPPADEETKPAEQSDTAQGEEAALVDAVADQATADKKKQNQLSDEEKAQKEAIKKLVAEKKYFVPVGQVSHRRNQRLLIIFAVLVVVLIGGYLAVDAGLIDLGVDVPVSLISN